MRRPRDQAPVASVSTFLRKVPEATLKRLERMDPLLVWVLRHLYGIAPCLVCELAAQARVSKTTIITRKEQALYLLGYKKSYLPEYRRTADALEEDLTARQRLAYLLENGISRGERCVASLALKHGSKSYAAISAASNFSVREASRLLDRLLARRQYVNVIVGERVKNAAFKELRQNKCNHKALLEARVLDALQKGHTCMSFAEELGIDFGVVCAVVREVRTELEAYRHTAARFRQRQQASRNQGGMRAQIVWLNSRLVPLYTEFREANTPFSPRERAYIRARIAGQTSEAAGRSALGVGKGTASIIDRLFLDLILPSPVVFPEELPLPPFTRQQEEVMRRIRYCKL